MADISDLVELSIEGYPSAVRIGAGGNAFATVQDAFQQPAPSSTVDVHVDSARWCVVGQWVIADVGGQYTVSAILDQWHVRLINMGLPGNASPAAMVPVGAKLTPSGVPGIASGAVTFATVKAALEAASSDVAMNSWGWTNLRATNFNAAGPTIGVAGVSGGPVIGQETSGPAGYLYLRPPAAGRWGIYTNTYVPVFTVSAAGVASLNAHRLEDVAAPIAVGDAVNLGTLQAAYSNSHGTAIANTVPGGPPTSGALARADHVHAIAPSVLQGMITAGGPFVFPNNMPLRWVHAGVDRNAVVLDPSGVFRFGDSGRPTQMDASTTFQVNQGGNIALSIVTGSVSVNATHALRIEGGSTRIKHLPAASVTAPPAGYSELFFDASNAGKLSRKDTGGGVVVIGTET